MMQVYGMQRKEFLSLPLEERALIAESQGDLTSAAALRKLESLTRRPTPFVIKDGVPVPVRLVQR